MAAEAAAEEAARLKEMEEDDEDTPKGIIFNLIYSQKTCHQKRWRWWW